MLTEGAAENVQAVIAFTAASAEEDFAVIPGGALARLILRAPVLSPPQKGFLGFSNAGQSEKYRNKRRKPARAEPGIWS